MGGTVSRVVPRPGGRLVREAGWSRSSDAGDVDVLLKLCDRDVDGGGPGGGGGKGMPGSHRFWLGERLTARGAGPVSPIPPVEAARRAAGGIDADSEVASGARAIACAVLSCKASMTFMGDAMPVVFAIEVIDESSLSAAFLDDDRTRWVEPGAGGGGNAATGAAIGDSVKNVEIG